MSGEVSDATCKYERESSNASLLQKGYSLQEEKMIISPFCY